MSSTTKIVGPRVPSQRFKDSVFESSQSPKALRPLKKLSAFDKNIVPTMVQNERGFSPFDLKRLDRTLDSFNKDVMHKSAMKGVYKSPITMKAH